MSEPIAAPPTGTEGVEIQSEKKDEAEELRVTEVSNNQLEDKLDEKVEDKLEDKVDVEEENEKNEKVAEEKKEELILPLAGPEGETD